MKKGLPYFTYTFAFLFLCSIISFSQSNSLPLFERDKIQELKWNSMRSQNKVAVLTYNQNVYQELKSSKYNSIAISIPVYDRDIHLKLEKNEIFADGFKLSTEKGNQINFKGGIHYKGIIVGEPSSTVAISFYDDEVTAIINDESGSKYVLGNSNALKNNSFLIYRVSETSGAPVFNCMAESLPDYNEKLKSVQIPRLEQRVSGGCVYIYFELGQSVFENKGSVEGAVNYLTGIFNVVSTLYARDGISVKISEIKVWTTPEPYSSSASTALIDFGNARQLSFNGNLAQLVRLKNGGSMSGIAWVDVLCTPFQPSSSAGPFSYAEISPTYNNLPSYSWTANVITHELGHNLGSPHTQSCFWTGGPIDNCYPPEGSCSPGPSPTNGGTIMSYCHLTSYGINFNNGFGTQPKELINNRVNSANCVVSCNAVSACKAPTGLGNTNITTSSAALSWSSISGVLSYDVQFKTANATTWTNAVTGSTTNSFNLTGLTASTNYQWQIKSNCSEGSSSFIQSSFTTLALIMPECTTPPNSLNVTGISTTSVTLNWSIVSGTVNYTVQYKTSDSPTWITAPIITNNSMTLTGLVIGTSYSWQVKANCSTSSSAFSTGQFATNTVVSCNAPGNLSVSNITSTSASLYWASMAGAFNYTIEIKPTTSSDWNVLGNTSTTSMNTTNLIANTIYDWRVKTNCATGISGYNQSQFTTIGTSIPPTIPPPPPPITCNPPSSITVGSITTTSANLTWTISPNAINYTFELKATTSTDWSTSINTNRTTLNITGLKPNTSYDSRVKANCGSGTGGFTSNSFTTTQPITPLVCNAPTGLTTINIGANTATALWAKVEGVNSFTLEYKLSSTGIWNVANSNINSTTYTLTGLEASSGYDWRVKSNCESIFSGYSALQFNTIGSPGSCPGLEDQSANENPGMASIIDLNTAVFGKISPALDNDYYKLVIPIAGSVTITLSGLPNDYDLSVYNFNGAAIASSQNPGLSNEYATLDLAPGTYFIKVYGWNVSSNDASCYTLQAKSNIGSISNTQNFNANNLSVKIFPNPVINSLKYQIMGLRGPAQILLIDLQGRILDSHITNEIYNHSNVSTLAPGFYMLQVIDEKKNKSVVKFLKTQ
ncbi:MAG: fibronectin type III domain-containing protein [Saprospiraceae bacterium]